MNKLQKLSTFSILLLTLAGNVDAAKNRNHCSSSSSACHAKYDCCEDRCSSRSNSCSSEKFCNNKQECTRGSRTLLVPRNQTLDAMNELALNNYFLYHNSPDACPILHTQISYFHKASNKGHELKRYFLKNNSQSLSVRQNGTGDIGSLWVNVVAPSGANFASDITICPTRKIDGVYFNFWADLNRYLCGSWAAISFAAYRSEARINFRETNRITHGVIPGAKDATEAFNNPSWIAGKLSNKCASRHGVDDVQFKLGWNYYTCNNDHAGLYLVAVAPTGKCDDKDLCCKPKNPCKRNRNARCGEFIWDPYIGSRHAGFGFGTNIDKTLWECGNQGVNLMLDFKYIYRFKKPEYRLFDLRRNGDFSRYLQVVTPRARQNSLPAVNHLFQKVDVTPRSLIELWTALHYEVCAFNLELGYNLFWRDAEKVCLKNRKCNTGCITQLRNDQVGIYDMTGDSRGNPISASRANISQSITGDNIAPSDTEFTYINRADLDLRSGSQPASLTNTIYGGVSYNSEIFCLPAMIGLSGSYEFASNTIDCRRNCKVRSSSSSDCHRNKKHLKNKDKIAIEQWGIAVKGDIAF